MATKRTRQAFPKKVSGLASASKVFLTPDAIQEAQRKQISTAYIEPLGGWVYYHPVASATVLAFLEDGISRSEQIRAMQKLIEESICNEDGSPFIQASQVAEMFSVDTIEIIVSAITEARLKEREARGNDSRR